MSVKSKYLRVLSLVLATLIFAFSFTGCKKEDDNGNNSTPAGSNGGAKEPIELTYWYPMWQNESELMKNEAENAVYAELEKITGVKVKFLHPPVTDNATAFATLFASKDLPDIIMHEYYVDYPGGPDKAIEDGVYIKLNKLIDQHAPNYKKLINSDKDIAKQTKTDKGNIWCFSMIDTSAQESYMGPMYRKDWLEKINKPVPTTIDELYDVLKAFKSTMNAQSPMLLAKGGVFTSSHMLVSAFGVTSDYYNDNGKIKFGPIENGYKEYLTTMNKWYKEGLIDAEFPTKTDFGNDITTGKAGVWEDGFWTSESWKSKATDKNFAMEAGPYPSLKKGEQVALRQQNYRVQQNNTAITSKCKYPERAVEWLDYKYSQEGFILCNYGKENESFKYNAEKKPEYTEFFTEKKNPKGYDYYNAQYYYLLGKGPYLREWSREMFAYPKVARDWMLSWHNSSTGKSNIPPYLTMTPDEGDAFNVIMGDIRTYVTSETVKFITGNRPISEFDKYVSEIKNMRIEEALKYKSAAWDRYNKR